MSAAVERVPDSEFIWRPVSATVEACSYDTKDEWDAIRLTGVGGSEAAAATGLSPFADATPQLLFLEKRCELPPKDLSGKLAVELGTRLESTVADMFADRTGHKVHRVNEVLRRRDFTYMLVNLDRRVVGQRACLECKTSGIESGFVSDEWGEDGTDQVPQHILVQAMHQLAVTGYEVCYVAALLAGLGFRIYVIERDQIFIDRLIAKLGVFWRCVQTGEPPAVTTIEDAKMRFPTSSKLKKIIAPPSLASAVLEGRKISAQIDDLEERLKAIKIQAMAYMGDAEILVDEAGNKLVTWPTVRAASEDLARELYPEQYAACVAPRLDTAALKTAIGAKAYENVLAPKTRSFSFAKEK